jgi:hypothetical protein
MKYQAIPQPHDVLRDLDSTIIPLVFQGLEDGTARARDYFESQGSRFDAFVAANLVRYHARLHLESSGQAAQFGMEDLTNNGLLLNYDMYRIRVLKADRGAVPAPGLSRARQLFWSQNFNFWQLELPFDWGLSFLGRRPLHLLLVWDVTPRYNLNELVLACPKKGNVNPSATEMYWTWPILHPAETMQTTPTWSELSTTDDLDISAVGSTIDDLDISAVDSTIDDLDISAVDDNEESEDRAAQ